MQIENCTITDVDKVFALYEAARQLQTLRKMVIWPFFEKEHIEREILNHQQWKLLIENEMVCNWTVTFSDIDIWEDREKGDAIYIHRLATNPNYRGNNFVQKMVDWAIVYAKQQGKKYVRLDTLGNNEKLIAHYTQCGFTFLGIVNLTNTQNLPLHYQKEPDCCLFEIEL